jgi:hypothetical protein
MGGTKKNKKRRLDSDAPKPNKRKKKKKKAMVYADGNNHLETEELNITKKNEKFKAEL